MKNLKEVIEYSYERPGYITQELKDEIDGLTEYEAKKLVKVVLIELCREKRFSKIYFIIALISSILLIIK